MSTQRNVQTFDYNWLFSAINPEHPPCNTVFSLFPSLALLPRPGFSWDHKEKFMKPVTHMKHSFWFSFFNLGSFTISLSFFLFWLALAFFLHLLLSFLPACTQTKDIQSTSHALIANVIRHILFVPLQKKRFMLCKTEALLFICRTFQVWSSSEWGQIALWQQLLLTFSFHLHGNS